MNLRNQFTVEKPLSIAYLFVWVCVRVALLIQHTTRVRHVVICLYGSSTFFDFSHKRHDFRRKGIEHKMCFFFCNLCLKRLSV